MLIIRSSSERLPDVSVEYAEDNTTQEYIGARSGTKLRSLSRLFLQEGQSATQFSDFLHAIVPLVYISASGGWKKARWTSWILAIFLEVASILSLPDSCKSEKQMRIKRLIAEATVRQPIFDLVLKRPGQAISYFWSKIPLLRDVNYLEYYLGTHLRYFYFHQ